MKKCIIVLFIIMLVVIAGIIIISNLVEKPSNQIGNIIISQNEDYHKILLESNVADGDIEETDGIELNKLKLLEDVNYMYILKNKVEEYLAYTKLDEKYALLNTLSEEYKDSKNYVYVEDLNEYNIISYDNIAIKQVYMVDESQEISFYIVDGFLYNNENKDIESTKIGVKLDFYNETYEIYPYEFLEENKLLNLDLNVDLKISSNYIAKNEYNTFSFLNVSDLEIANILLDKNKIEIDFLLNNGYSIDDIKFKNLNIDSLETIEKINKNTIDSCTRKKYNSKTIYNCNGSYGSFILEQKEGIEYVIICMK